MYMHIRPGVITCLGGQQGRHPVTVKKKDGLFFIPHFQRHAERPPPQGWRKQIGEAREGGREGREEEEESCDGFLQSQTF